MSVPSILPGPRGFVESDGEQIYFESWGSGDEAVVLSHGMGGNHAIWYQQVPVLAGEFRVVTWDQRGFGRSTNLTDDPGPVSSVADLAAILDHLDIEQAHLVGQSMGGWAAVGFALDHPDRTLSLVLADTVGGLFTPGVRQQLADYSRVIASSPPPDRLPLGTHPAIGAQLAGADLARAFLYSQIGGMASPPPAAAIAGLLAATDLSDRIGELTVPTLFVVGEHDPIIPPDLLGEVAALLPGSEFRVVEGTGHSPYFERADAWNDIVSEFLRRSG